MPITGKETHRVTTAFDMNNGLLTTTRDMIGISAYQTHQEECKTSRDINKVPTFNLLGGNAISNI